MNGDRAQKLNAGKGEDKFTPVFLLTCVCRLPRCAMAIGTLDSTLSNHTSATSPPILPLAAGQTYLNMSASAQQSFRAQLSGFRWANSVQDDSQPPPATSNSAFGRAWTGLSGYIPLRNEGRSQEEEAYFALSVGGMTTLAWVDR